MRKGIVGVLAVLCGLSLNSSALAAERGEQQDQTGQEIVQDQPAGTSGAAVQGRPAGKQPSAEEVRQMMQGVMGPMMGEMMSSMLKSMSKTLAEPQIAQNYATFTRNYYQALIDRGFSAEEALKIVSSTGLPSMGASK